jgi:predicted RNA-binding Zn ribbon-like protein
MDFVNTAEERGHPLCGDVLHTPEDLTIWGWRYGVIDRTASSEDRDSELLQAIDARELLYRLWFSRVHSGTDDPHDLRRLAQLTAEAHTAGWLEPADKDRVKWRWDRGDLASVRHIAVASALKLLTATGTSRLKQCPGDHCGWFFLDTTKRGNRRWCLMSVCGQAAKTAGRRQRASQASSTR